MTMQRQDYLRISKSIRMIRDQTLREIPDEDKPTRTVIHESYRRLAIQMARAFYAVNDRFHYKAFLRDALGLTDSAIAQKEFERLAEIGSDDRPFPPETS